MTDSTNSNTLFDDIYGNVLKMIKTKNINAGDLVKIATDAMVVVQRYPTMSGLEKKEVVTDIMVKIVNESGLLKPDDQQAAATFIGIILPVMIDTIKSVYNHEYDLKKIRSKWCFSCCTAKK